MALRRLSLSFSTSARAQVSPASGRLTDQTGLGPRRFYDKVSIDQVGKHEYAVKLDGASVRTPRQQKLTLPTASLATVVAAEWDAQKGRIRPSSMPMMTLVTTAVDVVPMYRSRIENSLLGYLDTDTICIRPSHPTELVEHQKKVLGRVVSHFENRGIDLRVTVGGLEAQQSNATTLYFTKLIKNIGAFELAAFDSATATAKSILVGAAMRDGALDVDSAIEAARSEERWQAKRWGEVEGGHDMDDADTYVRLAAADLIFRMVDIEPDAFNAVESEKSLE